MKVEIQYTKTYGKHQNSSKMVSYSNNAYFKK